MCVCVCVLSYVNVCDYSGVSLRLPAAGLFCDPCVDDTVLLVPEDVLQTCHYVSVCVCLLGVGAMVGADLLAGRDLGSSKNPLHSLINSFNLCSYHNK